MDFDHSRRFGGTQRLFGLAAAQRIFDAHVVVIGVGGVGSWTVEALARAGVGRLTLVDFDQVAESNINRQIQALGPFNTDIGASVDAAPFGVSADGSTLGMVKIDALKQRMAQINPSAQVQCIEEFATPENWDMLWARAVQFHENSGFLAVIDACDQLKTKQHLAVWALRQKVPFITAGAAGGKRLGHLCQIADLSQTTHDPLLASLRYRLRRENGLPKTGRMKIQAVFSAEAVQPAAVCDTPEQTDNSLNCHGYGSLVTVTAAFGMAAAGWALNAAAAQTP